jgi:hypothetical protein
MQVFESWVSFIREHASDADYRKDTDPSEGPKHYIDIDNYPEFVATGRIASTLDSVIARHGYPFVADNGFLPWATERTVDSLSNCMKRGDIAKAMTFAADLGHYVADGHMPLHITKNYDGQYTGNSGIHSRYESSMINSFIGQISYTGYNAEYIENVNQYIFNYIYFNHLYGDSILAADDYASALAGNTNSSTYKNALWNKTKGFTIDLFSNASHAFAALIYTAWVDAGKPSLSGLSVDEYSAITHLHLYQNVPNPFNGSTRINFSLAKPSKVLLQIRDLNGYVVATLANDTLQEGEYSKIWQPENLPDGIYLLVLNTGSYIETRKMVLRND